MQKMRYKNNIYIYVDAYSGCCRLLQVSAQWQRACLYWQFLNDFTKWLSFMLEYTFRWMVGGFFLGLFGFGQNTDRLAELFAAQVTSPCEDQCQAQRGFNRRQCVPRMHERYSSIKCVRMSSKGAGEMLNSPRNGLSREAIRKIIRPMKADRIPPRKRWLMSFMSNIQIRAMFIRAPTSTTAHITPGIEVVTEKSRIRRASR